MSTIHTVENLREHLQAAMELEHATIPVYLTALFSIKEGTNDEASQIIRSVVMEEMLHLTLVGNVLNAVGGKPVIDHPDFVPEFPCALPYSNGKLQVGLLRFCPEALRMFLRIEKPEAQNASSQTENFATIGQFYDGLMDAMRQLEANARSENKTIFTGDSSLQIPPEQFYYGGAGNVISVVDLNTAIAALKEVVDQGEGHDHSMYESGYASGHETGHQSGGADFSDRETLAHYYRFNEIATGRYYAKGDTSDHPPTGALLPVDWSSVWHVTPNPKMARFKHRPDVYQLMHDFNRVYRRLLIQLEAAFSGQPEKMIESVPIMYQLKDLAVGLMKIPAGSDDTTVGPSWEYLTELE